MLLDLPGKALTDNNILAYVRCWRAQLGDYWILHKLDFYHKGRVTCVRVTLRV